MAGLYAYHPQPVTPGAPEITLNDEESSHLVRSLRAKIGEKITAFDGTGKTWRGTVVAADARALVMRVEAEFSHPPECPALSLAQALPKGSVFDDVIRAAVELGVTEIFPLFSERCEVRLDAERAAGKLERWRSIAVEACKQSGNPFLPVIHAPVALKTWLAAPVPAGKIFRCVGSLEDSATPISRIDFSDTSPEKFQILIGPEGDFSPAEYEKIRIAGFRGVRFGKTVLRAGTAALYGLVALDQLRQRLPE